MNMVERQTLFLRGPHALRNPTLEVPNRLAANGKLNEMERHAGEVNNQLRLLKG
jgi:hypothetical protein